VVLDRSLFLVLKSSLSKETFISHIYSSPFEESSGSSLPLPYIFEFESILFPQKTLVRFYSVVFLLPSSFFHGYPIQINKQTLQ
jgi:hypothetical protein